METEFVVLDDNEVPMFKINNTSLLDTNLTKTFKHSELTDEELELINFFLFIVNEDFNIHRLDCIDKYNGYLDICFTDEHDSDSLPIVLEKLSDNMFAVYNENFPQQEVLGVLSVK